MALDQVEQVIGRAYPRVGEDRSRESARSKHDAALSGCALVRASRPADAVG